MTSTIFTPEGDEGLAALRDAIIVTVQDPDTPDLNMRQLGILLHVYCTAEPQTVRGLASYANINRPAVSRSLDKMESCGLLVREDDPADSRSIFVGKTKRGRDFAKKLRDSLGDWL